MNGMILAPRGQKRGSPPSSSRRIRRNYVRGRARRGGGRGSGSSCTSLTALTPTGSGPRTHSNLLAVAVARETAGLDNDAEITGEGGGQGLLLGVCLDILHTLVCRCNTPLYRCYLTYRP